MTKRSRQKFKNHQNEKRFSDEMKSIFHQFQKALSEAKKKLLFLIGESPVLVLLVSINILFIAINESTIKVFESSQTIETG